MSRHLNVPAYTCKKCRTDFIAYSKGLSCPKCGEPEESKGEGYNFINDQVKAMIWHKNDTGQFRGHSWGNFSLCDAIQWNIFNAFDYASQNPEKGWEDWAKKSYILDGDGKELKNEKYFHDLYKAIDEGLKTRADEIEPDDARERDYEERQKLARKRALKGTRIEYLQTSLFALTIFIGITIWLNAIQANWPIWSVWIITAVQILMYLATFEMCYARLRNTDIKFYTDFKFYIILTVFTILGIWARIGHLELVIVPGIVAIFLIISGMYNSTKNTTYKV